MDILNTFLHRATFAVLSCTLSFSSISCITDDGVQPLHTEQGRGSVRLLCHTSMEVSTRAALTANGKALTDLYVLDYDASTGRLLQVLHQTAAADDFAAPELMLDYGEHTLRIIATRSDTPSLLADSSTPWTLADNVLTAVSTSVPVLWTTGKTSDTFAAEQSVTVSPGTVQTVSVTLDRLVARLTLVCTDIFPSDCSTLEAEFNEYRSLSLPYLSVTDGVKNGRSWNVASLAGKTGTTLSAFALAPDGGYTTDITFTMNRIDGAPYATFTVPDVPLERNKVTTITGSFYNHQKGFLFQVNDTWSAETHDISI